jgi:hypothetical protein
MLDRRPSTLIGTILLAIATNDIAPLSSKIVINKEETRSGILLSEEDAVAIAAHDLDGLLYCFFR